MPWASGDNVTSSNLNYRGAAYNPKDSAYGAVGDGSTDDTAALQAAITAARGAGYVHLSAGTYKTTSTITLGTGDLIVGDGPDATVIQYSGAAGTYAFDTASDTTNDDIKLRDWKLILDTTGQRGIRFRGACGRPTVSRVYFRTPASSKVTNLVFLTLDGSYYNFGSQYHYVTHSNIEDCSFRGNDPGSTTPSDYYGNVGILYTGGLTGTLTGVGGSFQVGENILGTNSRAIAEIQAFNASTIWAKYVSITAPLARGEVITGQTSGATASLSFNAADPWYNVPRAGHTRGNEFSDLACSVRILGAENIQFIGNWAEECYAPEVQSYSLRCQFIGNRWTNDTYRMTTMYASAVSSGFSFDDTVTGQTNGATGRVAAWDGTQGVLTVYAHATDPTFADGEQVFGSSNGSITLIGSSKSNTQVGIFLNVDAQQNTITNDFFSNQGGVDGINTYTNWQDVDSGYGGILSRLLRAPSTIGSHGQTRRLYSAGVSYDTSPRWSVMYDGEMRWGSDTSEDIFVTRASAGNLSLNTASLSMISTAYTLPSLVSGRGYLYVDSASSLYWVNGSGVSTLLA